ncbi:MAG: nucleotidyltransferase domain-containing protein [Nitrospirae bacterium]|nr:nucleotidyltransferase domain-containing protein [Nitrospirota bacterium]
MDDLFLENILNVTLSRILAVVQPVKVILFGSAAKGKMHDNSDIDLLVIIPSGMHRRKIAQNIYRNLIGVGFAADIIVITEDDFEQFKEHKGMVIEPALKEGRLLYAA